jgi:hypothetical protein
VLSGTERLGLPPDVGEVGKGGTAGIDVNSVNRPAQLAEMSHAEGCIQPAGEGERERTARMHIA